MTDFFCTPRVLFTHIFLILLSVPLTNLLFQRSFYLQKLSVQWHENEFPETHTFTHQTINVHVQIFPTRAYSVLMLILMRFQIKEEKKKQWESEKKHIHEACIDDGNKV